MKLHRHSVDWVNDRINKCLDFKSTPMGPFVSWIMALKEGRWDQTTRGIRRVRCFSEWICRIQHKPDNGWERNSKESERRQNKNENKKSVLYCEGIVLKGGGFWSKCCTSHSHYMLLSWLSHQEVALLQKSRLGKQLESHHWMGFQVHLGKSCAVFSPLCMYNRGKYICCLFLLLYEKESILNNLRIDVIACTETWFLFLFFSPLHYGALLLLLMWSKWVTM